LVQRHIDSVVCDPAEEYVRIDRSTIETIRQREEGKATKVINLVKAIEKAAEENSDDPFLIAMAERAKVVQESFEDRQKTTAEALDELFKEIERNEQRKREQVEKGLDGLTFFVYRTLLDAKVKESEAVSKRIKGAFVDHPNWQESEKELRELRKKIIFAVFTQEDDMEKVTAIVENLLNLLRKARRI
jgi:type I restriction enzyme R subunit